jgi:hypothetical protein
MSKKIFLILLFILFNVDAFSQSGIRYIDFTKKLENYFHSDLILDITDEIGRIDFTVWSWDVGDFSGDNINDVAFCIRRTGAKNKSMEVYLFADIDGFLVQVGKFEIDFVEIPLEVGVAIRDGAVYITQKFKQFNWQIVSYKFENGSLIKQSDYTTGRKGKYTHEIENNYINLRNTERYLITNTGKLDFGITYFKIPSYNRNRFIYKGITDTTFINDVLFCPVGAYWWQGDSDFCFSVSSVYDDNFLYMTINVQDDSVVQPYHSILNGEAIEIWIDPTNYTNSSDRFAVGKDDITYQKMPTNDLYKVEIYAGDFINKEPTMQLVKINGNDIVAEELNNYVIANLTDYGYNIIFKIPFVSLIGKPLLLNDEMFEWGMTVRVIDVDNDFRPDRRTILQTSVFEEGNPSSFGSIIFIPDNKWYGETKNIYSDKIIQVLEEFGF